MLQIFIDSVKKQHNMDHTDHAATGVTRSSTIILPHGYVYNCLNSC